MIQFIYKIAILNGEHDHRPSDFWGLCTQLHGVSFDTSASMSRAHIPKKKWNTRSLWAPGQSLSKQVQKSSLPQPLRCFHEKQGLVNDLSKITQLKRGYNLQQIRLFK